MVVRFNFSSVLQIWYVEYGYLEVFRESLEIRDNENRLYLLRVNKVCHMHLYFCLVTGTVKDPDCIQADSEDLSDYVNAQADINLRWAHIQCCRECCVLVPIYLVFTLRIWIHFLLTVFLLIFVLLPLDTSKTMLDEWQTILWSLIWVWTICSGLSVWILRINAAVWKPRFTTKIYLYNVDPLKPHFYIVKLRFTGVYIIFLISAQKYRLWILVRTASARRF